MLFQLNNSYVIFVASNVCNILMTGHCAYCVGIELFYCR